MQFKPSKLNDKGGKMLPGKKNRWYVEYYILDGNRFLRKRSYQVNKYHTTKDRYTYARAEMKELDKLLKEKQKVAIGLLLPALREMLEVKKCRKKTYDNYNSILHHIEKYFGKKRLQDLTKKDVLLYKDELIKQGKGAASVNKYLSCFRSLLAELVKRERIKENPATGVKNIKTAVSYQNQAFSTYQVSSIKKLLQDNDLKFAIQLMFYCFIRPGEIRFLQTRSFDFRHSRILIDANISKNKTSSFVTIPGCVLPEWKEHLNQKAETDFVIGTGTKRVGKNLLYERHKKILKHLSLDKSHTFYSWKHTGVVTAYRSGVDIKSIQLQCRHSSLEMTDIYLKSLGLYTNKSIMHKMPKW